MTEPGGWIFVQDDEWDETQGRVVDELLRRAQDFSAASGDMTFYAADGRIRAAVSVCQVGPDVWVAHVIDNYHDRVVKNVWATRKVERREVFTCPICGAARPDEMHQEWCDYDGEEDEDDDE